MIIEIYCIVNKGVRAMRGLGDWILQQKL